MQMGYQRALDDYNKALEDWKDSLGDLVTVVENGRKVLASLGELLDHGIEDIRNGLHQLGEPDLRQRFVNIRDTMDSKIDTLNQSLNAITPPIAAVNRSSLLT